MFFGAKVRDPHPLTSKWPGLSPESEVLASHLRCLKAWEKGVWSLLVPNSHTYPRHKGQVALTVMWHQHSLSPQLRPEPHVSSPLIKLLWHLSTAQLRRSQLCTMGPAGKPLSCCGRLDSPKLAAPAFIPRPALCTAWCSHSSLWIWVGPWIPGGETVEPKAKS